MKKNIKNIIIGLIVIFVAFFLWQRFGGKDGNVEHELFTVKKGTVAETVSDSGEVHPVEYADLSFSFELPMIIEWVGVEVGDTVEKDQVLARIDRNRLATQIHTARIDVEKAISAEEQARRKWDDLKPEERYRIKKDVEQARSRLATAQAQWTKTEIHSPIDGVIARQEARVGEVASGEIIRVIDPGNLRIEALMSESDITHMYVGQDAEITFDAFDDEKFKATITQIDPEAVILQDVTYYRILLDLEHIDERVRSGMSVDVDIVVTQKDNVLIIPLRFARSDDNGAYVYVQEGEEFVKKHVELGVEGDDGNVEVISGLQEGQEIFAVYEENDE